MQKLNAYKTIAKTVKMSKVNGLLSLLTIATVGMISLPAEANGYRVTGDSAVIQNSQQRAVVTGSGNNVQQNSRQTHIDRTSGGFGNQGIVQEQTQDADVYGRHNHVRQNNRQTTVETSTPRYSPRHAPRYQKKPNYRKKH
ncbi:hypothetical protein [Phormidium sp. CCY1219]|uniref:hypothetical protein n=1 Tax=Phormidium sp. CCY1219 TaxID=2886104 RepID=UPI002D1EE4D8|nr:hypothetical protein [Phormidium sp. CCY1219]MEB3829404.1 hypothetical protein [Phormidium sp. CCY1219]